MWDSRLRDLWGHPQNGRVLRPLPNTSRPRQHSLCTALHAAPPEAPAPSCRPRTRLRFVLRELWGRLVPLCGRTLWLTRT